MKYADMKPVNEAYVHLCLFIYDHFWNFQKPLEAM